MNQNQTGRHADLPLMQPGTERCVAGSQIQVGVFENDQRIFTAQFQRHLFQIAPGDFGDFTACASRAGKSDHLHIGVTTQRFARVRRTRQNMQQAFGQTGFLEQPGNQKPAADRGLRIRFEHHRIAGGQRRGHRAQGQHQREIERRDDPTTPCATRRA